MSHQSRWDTTRGGVLWDISKREKDSFNCLIILCLLVHNKVTTEDGLYSVMYWDIYVKLHHQVCIICMLNLFFLCSTAC